jgi:hypothetical protein
MQALGSAPVARKMARTVALSAIDSASYEDGNSSFASTYEIQLQEFRQPTPGTVIAAFSHTNTPTDGGGFFIDPLIEVHLDGSNVRTLRPTLGTGETEQLTTEFSDLDPGQHTVELRVTGIHASGDDLPFDDGARAVVNGTVEVTEPAPEEPDVQVTDLQFSPGDPTAGDVVEVTADLTNRGDASSGPVDFEIRKEGELVEGVQIQPVAPGDQAGVATTTTVERSGEITFEAGSREETITVDEGAPDLTVTGLRLEKAQVSVRENFGIEVVVENTGSGAAENEPIPIQVDGERQKDLVVNLPPGRSTTLSDTLTIFEEGAKTVTVGGVSKEVEVGTDMEPPATIEVQGIEVSPSPLTTDASATLSVSVENTGGQEGSESWPVRISGRELGSVSTPDIPAGDQTSVDTSIRFNEAGTFEVSVGGASTTVTVQDSAITTPTEATNVGPDAPVVLLGGAGALGLVLLLVTLT